MVEHIIKNNESLEDILNMYHISFMELREYNNHITDFKHLVSGTKLMVPLMNGEVEQILEKTEGFVMDYYPKITEDIIPSLDEGFEKEVQKEERLDAKVEKKEENFDAYKTPYPGIVPPRTPYKGR